MARGGKRPGAGRPPGAVNKISEKARKAAAEGGVTPLDFLLQAMRDDAHEFGTRLDAAKAAAPYMHAKLSSIEHSGNESKPVVHEVRRTIVRP